MAEVRQDGIESQEVFQVVVHQQEVNGNVHGTLDCGLRIADCGLALSLVRRPGGGGQFGEKFRDPSHRQDVVRRGRGQRGGGHDGAFRRGGVFDDHAASRRF